MQYRGRTVVLSLDAIKNLVNLRLPSGMLDEILLEGTDFRDSKMSKGEVGLAAVRRGNLLFVKLVPSHAIEVDEEIWIVKHVGIARRGR